MKNRTYLRSPRETTCRAAGAAKSAPMKTPSTAPPAAADEATTASGTPDSTVRPHTDRVPPASLTDEEIVISGPSLVLLDCCCVDETLLDVADDPLAASRLLIEHLLPDPTHQNQYQYQPITRTPARAETNSGRIRTHRTGVGGGRGSGHGVEARSEDARSSGREGRVYIRRGR